MTDLEKLTRGEPYYEKLEKVYKLTLTALMAALSYVVFTIFAD